MKNIHVELITKPDFCIPSVIGGLAQLTQHKKYFEPTTKAKGLAIMQALVDMGHTSLLECADFGFIFGSTSRVFLAQITRHRLASYTSGSQQYQDHDNFPYVTPDAIAAVPGAQQVYDRFMNEADIAYCTLKTMGISKDDARYVLPGAASNHLYAKFNLREIVCIIMPQRLCRRNTPEPLHNMRKMCQAMINANFEYCIRLGGCACVTDGKCDQGKMCCGKPYTSWDEMVLGP